MITKKEAKEMTLKSIGATECINNINKMIIEAIDNCEFNIVVKIPSDIELDKVRQYLFSMGYLNYVATQDYLTISWND